MNDHANAITSRGLDELQAQLRDLEQGARRQIAERIRVAREWGDLKENAEYHDAKNEQAHLETRIARLRERISRSVVVDQPPTEGVVGFGSTVTVRDEQGAEHTWQIVSSHEAAPGEGRLSADSPVARALAGRRAGEQARIDLPRGARVLTLVRIS